MKYFYFTIALLFSLNSFSQNDLLGEWFLHYIEIDGVQQYSTIPNSYNVITFNDSDFNGVVCDNGYSGDYLVLDANHISIPEVVAFAGFCNYLIETNLFLNPYLWTVLDNNSMIEPFEYVISGSGNAQTLSLTNSQNYKAFYGRASLSENRLPGNWFLHAITKNGNEELNTFQPNFNMNFTLTAGSFSSLDYNGTAVCNDYFGEYHLDGIDNIKVLGISFTLAICDENGGPFEESYLSFFADSNTQDDMLLNFNVLGSGDTESLVLTDLNGDFLTYGRQVLTVDENTLRNLELHLIENPVKSELRLKIDQSLGNLFNYEIFSLDGKMIMKGQMNKNHSVNVETLNSGMYFLKVSSQDNFKQSLKFVKE